jgi:hypothetical protein
MPKRVICSFNRHPLNQSASTAHVKMWHLLKQPTSSIPVSLKQPLSAMQTTCSSPHAEQKRSQHQDNLDPQMSNQQQRAPEGTGSRKEGKDPICKSMNSPHACFFICLVIFSLCFKLFAYLLFLKLFNHQIIINTLDTSLNPSTIKSPIKNSRKGSKSTCLLL